MNKKWFWLLMVVLGVVIFVGGPLFVQYTHWPQGTTGHGDWLSFWGSYLGVIPSGLIAYFVVKIQIDAERHNEHLKRNEDLYIQDLREIHELINEIRLTIVMMTTVFEDLKNDIGDAEYFAKTYIAISEKNKHQLRYNEYFNNALETLPKGSSSSMVNEIKDMIKSLERLEVNTEFYLNKIKKGENNKNHDTEYKEYFINDFRMLGIKYEMVARLIKKEISKYYIVNEHI
ncbi:hypothetical protein GCM10025879_20010 [Leuconostoc litchii]|uniref:Uncharacterized protein n=1 Tax=Leuconostoc litchii TaxID=1981069 RepID=A0A6P2CLI3_9LACO|nr:hypothetical protein [Leuconostoc litchii]TYC46855.1 hypothetical protein ESZ47_01560 [Leuconostoc litchii]GMA70755.1 hypothetical protein GCM10025879_20010 [Leuconostoc litchii]